MTVNRFCSSGLNAVSIAADRIRTGEADVMIAAGTESMSMIPMLGRLALNADVFARDENVGIAYGMGLTAEKVATQWKVSREEQDAFALASHQKALAAQARASSTPRSARSPSTSATRTSPAGHRRARRIMRSRATRVRVPTRRRRRPREAAAGVRGEGLGHRGQQLADVRRRGRVDRSCPSAC